MTDELVLMDENGREHRINGKNQRAYRHREIRCAGCEHQYSFDELPAPCPKCDEPGPHELVSEPRFWWDQSMLERTRLLIIGCGAIGNEIAKNMAMVGVRHYTLIDFDHVEKSNRARCVLFNEHTLGDEEEGSVMKVDAMARGLKSIDENVEVEAMATGVLDDISAGIGGGQPRSFARDGGGIDSDGLMELAENHDLCIVAVDGIAPIDFINRWIYPFIPMVQAAMSAGGGFGRVKVTIPMTTSCLTCHEVGGMNMDRYDDGTADWTAYYRKTGQNCGMAALAAGAASFGHTTAYVSAVASSQTILVLHGWPAYLKSGWTEWPVGVPLPLWNESAEIMVYAPDRQSTKRVSFECNPKGNPLCPTCSVIKTAGGSFSYALERFPVRTAIETPRFVDPSTPSIPPKRILGDRSGPAT